MWVHLDIIQSQQWIIVTNRKSKGKTRASFGNVVSASSREDETDVASLTNSEKDKLVRAAEQDAAPMEEPGLANIT